jgi:AcrR family transcriptional regulator
MTEKATGSRARNRIVRTSAFLSTALEIVTAEGFDALTMQRLADECDSAIGAVYRYFPSKGALVAEVQREAIDRIGLSYALIRDRSDREWSGLSERELAVTRLVLFSRFICATAQSLPQELRLMQMLMGETRGVVPIEEAMRVYPTAMRLLDQLRGGIDAAVEHGMLDPGDTMARVVTWAAAISGVMQVSHLEVFDASLFDGDALARQLSLDLLAAWGADRGDLDGAVDVVDALAASGPLAPTPAPAPGS